MHDHIHVIEQNPRAAVVASHAVGALADFLAILDHAIGDRPHLAIRRARADHREVGHRAQPSQIKNDQIISLVVMGDLRQLDRKLVGIALVHKGMVAQNRLKDQTLPLAE